MMYRLLLFFVLAALALGTAPNAQAQQRSGKNLWEQMERTLERNTRYPRGVLRDREEEYRRDRSYEGYRYEDYRYEDRGSGPPFCRSGAGHPVHGRRWCIDKGFGLGDDDHYYRRDSRTLEDVIFGDPRDRRRDEDIYRRDDDVYRRYPDDRDARSDRTQRGRPSTHGIDR